MNITDACNYRCPYCYRASSVAGSMSAAILLDSLRSAMPRLRDEATVVYCGGEPLLALPAIRRAVEFFLVQGSGRRLHHSLTSNGSLLDRDALAFFDRHRFRLLLSFDGLAQEARHPGSHAGIERLLSALPAYPGIRWRVNATYSSRTVRWLFESIREMVLRNVPAVSFSLAENTPWDKAALAELARQLRRLADFLAAHYRQTGQLPVPEFQPRSRPFLFACGAGRDRLAVDVQGRVWGCNLFADAFRNQPQEWLEAYLFGDGPRAWQNNPHARLVRRNYRALHQDRFRSTDRACWSCPSVTACATCPAANLLNGAPVPEVVPRTSCRLQRISIAARRRFAELAAR